MTPLLQNNTGVVPELSGESTSELIRALLTENGSR